MMMMEKNRQYLPEEEDDEALAQLMDAYAEAEGEALWRAFQAAEAAGTAPEVPAELDEACRRQLGKQPGKRRNRIGNGMSRAAVIGLILLCLMPPLVMTADALKFPILNFVVDVEDRFSAFTFGKKVDQSVEQDTLVNRILSVPPPEGYHFTEQGEREYGIKWLVFEDENSNKIRITIVPSLGTVQVDTEDADQITMEINKHEVVYLEKMGRRLMYFDAKDEAVIDIHAFELDENVFWKYVYQLLENIE